MISYERHRRVWDVVHERRPLSESKTSHGRPVWEPPVVHLIELLDLEDYEKRRDAILKYSSGDPAKATEFLDLYDEVIILGN